MIDFYLVCDYRYKLYSVLCLTKTGTDHPFFPPLDEKEDSAWLSVSTNFAAIEKTLSPDQEAVRAVLGGNAVRILNLN
jgi:hypothetical protein